MSDLLKTTSGLRWYESPSVLRLSGSLMCLSKTPMCFSLFLQVNQGSSRLRDKVRVSGGNIPRGLVLVSRVGKGLRTGYLRYSILFNKGQQNSVFDSKYL